MARRQSQVFRRPQKRSTRSSGSGAGCIGIAFALVVGLVVLGVLAQFLQTPSGGILILLLIGLVVAFFVWRKRKRDQQKQAWLAQQQQYAQWQHQQQQIQWQQQEWERKEQERQEREKIARLHSLGDILTLSPKEFEVLTGKILEASGYHDIQVVGGSGDLGVDIFALDQYGNKVAVQCKRYAPGNSVGSPAIQTFFGMMIHHEAQIGVFVTTSTFSQPATFLAAQRGIRLIDGNQFISLLQGLQLHP
jgi:restriction endonuclease Mrr